jgi:hypothetical protein
MEPETCYPLLENFEICAFEDEGSAKLRIIHTKSGKERKFDCVHSVTNIPIDKFDEWRDDPELQEKTLESLRMVTDQSEMSCDTRMFGARSYAEGLSEIFMYSDPSAVFQVIIDTDLQTIGTDYPLNSEIASFIAKHEPSYESQYIDFLGRTLMDDQGEPLCNPITSSLEKFYGDDEIKKLRTSLKLGCGCPKVVKSLEVLEICAETDPMSVTEAHLGNNQLNELPESIGNLQALQVLDLVNYRLTELPESIGNLQSLEVLSLGGNQLTELPESMKYSESEYLRNKYEIFEPQV